jgi:hypothetical protein
LPPHPANPRTKRPLVALRETNPRLRRGRRRRDPNPIELDYRALSNAGLRCLGRLQPDADRARVVDGLAATRGVDGDGGEALRTTLQRLASCWFLVRNAHSTSPHDFDQSAARDVVRARADDEDGDPEGERDVRGGAPL